MTTALVIDDNRQPADIICKLLRLLDIEAHPAYGSRAALIYLRERIPDIIYLDISMPGVDGFEIMAFLRREPRLLHIPVVIVTSDDQPETTRLALSQGALDVIIKPATIEALERTLKSAKLTP